MEKKKIFIFVEGVIDLRVVTSFIGQNYNFQIPQNLKGEVRIENTNIIIDIKTLAGKGLSGCSAIEHTERHEDIKDYTSQGYQCLAILDTDTTEKNAKTGGYKQRKEWLVSIITTNNLSFNFFLLPNNQDDGDLEVLLRGALPPEQQGIINCIEQFNNCLEKHKQFPDFKQEQNKDLLYNTCYKVFGKDFKIDYTNAVFNPLKNFLDGYLL
jgi:hypothetical protein